MARRLFYGRGKAQIELSGQLHELVDRVLDGSAREVAQELEDTAKRIHDKARADWPEKTGKSKDGLTYGLRIPDPAHLEAFVGGTTSYDRFIHKPWPETGKFVLQDLIIKPGRREAKALADRLSKQLRKLAEGKR